MTTDVAAPQRGGDRLARMVTEVLAPAVWAAVMPTIIAIHAATSWTAGIGWATLAVLFGAAIPYGVIWLGVRRGKLTDHHIGVREQRRMPLVYGLISVLAGFGLLIGLGAPRQLVVMVAGMFGTLLVTTLINQVWKLSAHTAVSAASISALVVVFGPLLLFTAPLVALIGWSRVRLRDHTPAQVTAGTMVGAAIGTALFTLFG